MTCLKFGITGVFPLNMVGNQYADRSSGARHDVLPTPAACSEASVVRAFVVLLPVKLCSCDAPGRLGRTIGASDNRCVTSQFTWSSWCVTSSAGSAPAVQLVSSAATATEITATARCLLITPPRQGRGRALSNHRSVRCQPPVLTCTQLDRNTSESSGRALSEPTPEPC